jgi:hypothetical protein
LLELGDAEALFDTPAAIEHLTAAFEQRDDVALRGAAAVTLTRTLVLNNRADESLAVIRRASDELVLDSDVRLALEALELMAPVLGTGRQREDARRGRSRR